MVEVLEVVVGFVLGLGVGLTLAAIMAMRMVWRINELMEEVGKIARQFTGGRSTGGGGLLGTLIQTLGPQLAGMIPGTAKK